MSAKFRYIQDPGHGWLEVPGKVLAGLGIADKISSYSYQTKDGRLAYLEEDCDMPLFIAAWGAKRQAHGEAAWDEIQDHLEEEYHHSTFVRQLPSYGSRIGSFYRH